jgi:hypothetical protein
MKYRDFRSIMKYDFPWQSLQEEAGLSSQAASLPPDPLKVNKKGDFIERRIGPSMQMLPRRFFLEHSITIAKSPVLFEGS